MIMRRFRYRVYKDRHRTSRRWVLVIAKYDPWIWGEYRSHAFGYFHTWNDAMVASLRHSVGDIRVLGELYKERIDD
jgi:hypothetical protein